MFDSDFEMTCNAKIPSVVNALKMIYLGTNIFNGLTSTYYDDKDDSFAVFFQQHTYSYITNNYHPFRIKI